MKYLKSKRQSKKKISTKPSKKKLSKRPFRKTSFRSKNIKYTDKQKLCRKKKISFVMGEFKICKLKMRYFIFTVICILLKLLISIKFGK